jgi:hypothetical protein
MFKTYTPHLKFTAKDVMKDATVQIKNLLTIPAKSSLILEINK